MTSAAAPDSLTDYSTTIKAEIVAAVKELISKLAWMEQGDWEPTARIEPQYIELGYLINTHHGVDLYAEGDRIEGILVRIDRERSRILSVCADDVLYTREAFEDWDDDDDEEDIRARFRDEHERMNACASMIW